MATTHVQHEKRVYLVQRRLYVPRNEKTQREDYGMKRLSILAAGLLVGAAALQYSNVASSQDGWITLLDSSKQGDWTEVGKANWAMKDGALAADKLDGKDLSYLVSKDSYKDFQIKAEFWTDEEANSGIFIRCDVRTRSTPRSAMRSTSSTNGRTRATAPVRSSTLPRLIRCRKRRANGIPTRSPHKA